MKRSEMVQVIEDYLEICPDLVDHTNKDKAEYIIGCCETWGMLPPDAMPPALSLEERATKDAIWARTRFKWEPEND